MSLDSISPFWTVTPFGAEDDNQQQNNQQNDQQQNNQSNNQGGQGNSNTDTQQQNSQNTDDDDDPYKGLSTKELKRLLADTETGKKTAEQARDTAQGKVTEAERKNRTDLENTQTDLKNEQATTLTLREALKRQTLVNGILLDTRFQWHDIDDVLAKMPESVKVSDDGKIEGLTKALGTIAKDKPHLLKSQAQQDNNQQQNNQQQNNNNNGPTGFQPGQGGANQGGALPPNAQQLASSYPALASRITGVPQYQIPQPIPHVAQ